MIEITEAPSIDVDTPPSVAIDSEPIALTITNAPEVSVGGDQFAIAVTDTRFALNIGTDNAISVTEQSNTVRIGGQQTVAIQAPTAGVNVTPGTLVVVNTGSLSQYVHTQNSASTTWTINHNLGRRVQVILTDLAGNEVDAYIANPTLNQTVVTYTVARTGYAVID